MKILFVCTGNVFRSLSAEYGLKKYITNNKIEGMVVSSAGINANERTEIDPIVIKTLNKFNINPKKHIPRIITKKIIDEQDLIVAMSTNHQTYIKNKFGIEVPLFNEIAFHKKEPIKDNIDIFNIKNKGSKEWNQFNSEIVEYILKSTPQLYKNLNVFLNNFKLEKTSS